MIKAGQAYDPRNEFEHRDEVDRELALKYDKRQDIIIPVGKKLGFNGTAGEQVTLQYDSSAFKIVIDGLTVVELATDASVTTLEGRVTTAEGDIDTAQAAIITNASNISTVDGKLTASYGLTVDVNGRIASMKLLSNGTTSTVAFTASTFQVYNGSTNDAPFEVSGGVVKIKTANVGNLTADSITAGTLSVARIADGTLDTIKLALNAITAADIYEGSEVPGSPLNSTSSYVEIGEVTLDVPANAKVRMDWSLFAEGSNASTSDTAYLQVKITRQPSAGGSEVDVYETYAAAAGSAYDLDLTDVPEIGGVITIPDNHYGHVSGFDSDAPSAAEYDYRLYVRHTGGSLVGGAWGVSMVRLAGTLFKR